MNRTIVAITAAALSLGAVASPVLAQSYTYSEHYEYRDNGGASGRYYNGDPRYGAGYYAPPPRYAAPRYQGYRSGYDGYRSGYDGNRSGYADGYGYDNRTSCQQAKHENGTAGLVLGAIAGGVLGNNVTHRGNHGAGTAIGALAGAALGNSIGRNSAKDSGACNEYGYGYDRGQQGYAQPYSYERERYSYGH
jgi:hypothetical protein